MTQTQKQTIECQGTIINLTDIKSVSIQAGRWFQKSYGNTYHRVKITIEYLSSTGERIMMPRLISEIRYGYGECWNQTALDLFCKELHIDKPNGAYLTTMLRDLDIPYASACSDVARERDLKDFNF